LLHRGKFGIGTSKRVQSIVFKDNDDDYEGEGGLKYPSD
jgi:hypothetical protein